MSAPIHPRRRSYKAGTPDMTPPPATLMMSLQKNKTYASPKAINTDVFDPVADAAFTPKRSPTCSRTLEDLIADPRQVQVKKLLDDFDKAVSGEAPLHADAGILNDKEVLPVPRFLLDRQTMVGRVSLPSPPVDPMDIDEKEATINHQHASDSGLGASVSESGLDMAARSTARSTVTSVSSSFTAVTASASAPGERNGRFLSEAAVKHIREKIVSPILGEESLKEFHPLVQDIPRRIGIKSITTLRDLEKTLTFLAPEFSVSDKSYLSFCRVAIRCVQTTTTFLNDQDLRRPTDAPYTNGYFLNLWSQITRYAAIIRATREKEAKGENLNTMDYSRDEKIVLRGGLSNNGRPLELVREKDGKTIPIVEGSADYDSVHKRPSEEDDVDEEGIMRSMARRRKSDKPGDVVHPCTYPGCDKVFKRNCDLGKHEKTHTRPFKCSESTCKYHHVGWPTEKERDRHENDKHLVNPTMYKCQYQNCTYTSKRESNCKQHMEKAHGWEYVRSKSNGKRKPSGTAGSSRVPSTPLTPFIATPPSVLTSPSVQSANDFAHPNMWSITPAVGPEDFRQTSRRESETTGTSSLYSPIDHMPSTGPITPEEQPMFHQPSDFGFMNFTWPNPAHQQPTPALSTGNAFDDLDFNANFGNSNNLNVNNNAQYPQLSPGAQADATLYSPQDLAMDEGLGDSSDFDFNMGGDFTLFDNSSNVAPTTQDNFWHENAPFGGYSNPLEPLFLNNSTMDSELEAILNGTH